MWVFAVFLHAREWIEIVAYRAVLMHPASLSPRERVD